MQARLPLLPGEAVPIGDVAGLVEDEERGAVFVWGALWWSWQGGDTLGRRLAAVQLVRSGVARRSEVAAAFGVNYATVWRWEREWELAGVGALAEGKRGPKGAWRVTEEVEARIVARAREGGSQQRIASEVGVSRFSVRRVLAARSTTAGGGAVVGGVGREGDGDVAAAGEGVVAGAAVGVPADVVDDASADGVSADAVAFDFGAGDVSVGAHGDAVSGDVVADDETDVVVADDEADVVVADEVVDLPVVPRPTPRTAERQAARYGDLLEAAPVFTSGRELPLAGLLLALPTLQAAGLLSAAEETFGALKRGFYGLRSVLLTLVFLALVREPRAEGLSRIVPSDLGRVLGLDRAPEVGTLRRKLTELADTRKAGLLLQALARYHARAQPEALGFLYIDGHVRAYHGERDLPKSHVARMRISMPATLETWFCDQRGDPVFAVTAEPSASLVREIERLLPELRALAGERRVTIVFDRGGWSPSLFAKLLTSGFDLLTYRKGKSEREPPEAFTTHTWTDERGTENTWQLAERTVTVPLPSRAAKAYGKRELELRQITRQSGDHHTTILTSRTDLSASELAGRMFLRWRQENYFRYAREHYALDALDTYASTADDPERSVPNPEKRRLKSEAQRLRARLTDAEAAYGTAALTNPEKRRRSMRGFKIAHSDLGDTIRRLKHELEELDTRLAATPARVPLKSLGRDARVLDHDIKLITHAARIAAFNAESALARQLAPHYARANDEGRALIREALTSSGDIRATPTTLHVTLNALATPRRTRALASLCTHLTATETSYPGTNLTIRYAVKPHPTLA